MRKFIAIEETLTQPSMKEREENRLSAPEREEVDKDKGCDKKLNETTLEVVVDRTVRTVNSTIATVHVNGAFVCYVLEDADRGLKSSMALEEIQQRKLKGATCIPEGRYECRITYSPHFKRTCRN